MMRSFGHGGDADIFYVPVMESWRAGCARETWLEQMLFQE